MSATTPTEQAIDLVWQDIYAVRSRAPLVHNITNYVVMNISANALLAAGASPVMAHAPEEVADLARIAGALVVNIGTLSSHWVAAMQTAIEAAHMARTPIVLDPVGAGATPFRDATLVTLLDTAPPTVIRGNASEIMAVAGFDANTRGVDSTTASHDAIEAASQLAARTGSVVCVSGEIDYVIDAAGRVAELANGDEWLTRMTGTGCSASALIGAFCAVQGDPWRATVSAMSLVAIAGEIAGGKVRERGQGVGSLQATWLDALQLLTRDQLAAFLRVEGFPQ
ncbi:hydroxyethylthiazole kinase [Andreprevotia lacus DSM 23236]|jgi:hydroxyethylthiazole kinase|uniref:Hydroxyethylthiazole kinase n=1 Tax=Andreprevotia lacus DSM 23236 TaxID=1121001 RepID=A0A1W1XVC7_9NEIS|nr:hydroxyethylthiazole kinase [Andreprevotia lacus]SMC27940.1 hydroxyethylthiazole kinase [Andreprevotia lacus DSM 23236]